MCSGKAKQYSEKKPFPETGTDGAVHWISPSGFEQKDFPYVVWGYFSAEVNAFR